MVYRKLRKEEKDCTRIEAREIPSDKERKLEGNTLRVYWYLLTNGTKGIRETQKDLNFSSPSTASYQLKKLVELGLITRIEESDKYSVKEEIKTGIFGFYIRIGYKMVPRYLIYLIIHLVGLICFFALVLTYGTNFFLEPVNLLLFFYLIFVSIFLIVESSKIWKMRPI